MSLVLLCLLYTIPIYVLLLILLSLLLCVFSYYVLEKSENSDVFGLGIINYARGIAYKAFYPGMLN